MHKEARDFIAGHSFDPDDDLFVVEIGSRYINGEVRDLIPYDCYHGIDVEGGKGVDEIADGASWYPEDELPGLVVCCEVFEHTPDWPMIVKNVSQWINGTFLITCAATSREPHSAVDGGELRPGEFYKNLSAKELKDELVGCGFQRVKVQKVGDDLQASGVKFNG